MTTTTEPEVRAARKEPAPPGWQAAGAGLAAAVAALAAAEVVAALLGGTGSPVTAIGNTVIDLAPPALKDWAVEVLGTADKPALITGVLLVLAAFAALTGIAAVHRFWIGATGVLVLGALGLAAALADEGATNAGALLPPATATVTGIAVLRMLTDRLRGHDTAGAGPGRRAFLRAAGAVGFLSLVAGGAARWLLAAMATPPTTVELPPADDPLPPVPRQAALRVDGLSPLITPNEDFYRIDTALRVPAIAVDEWRLRIHGMVDRPTELTYDDIRSFDLVEADITLACVSNEIGGQLVGNARWLGARLSDVLAGVGVQPGADQLVGRAVDGFTTGAPLDVVLDGRDALIAIGMNGEPLPRAHGFPARLVVPGLYGYVSATKWLAELELTTFDAFDAYWVPRGWAEKAPIKTQSRIDVPRRGAHVPTGTVMVAGVAWAPSRGISDVEVQIDDGPWEPARLSDSLGDDAWRQWVYEWQATEGRHRIRVRATDGTGQTQTEEIVPPRPDGATGWHTIDVTVSAA